MADARRRPRRRGVRGASSRPRDGGTLDLRRTLRPAMRTEGSAPSSRGGGRSWCRAGWCILVDVSGSMEPYARAMIMFLQAVARAARHVEVFAFGTRLSRLTGTCAGATPRSLLHLAAAAVPDWGGGTRIGESLPPTTATSAAVALTRGAVVVVVSDGWERGDLDLLDRELDELRAARTAGVGQPAEGPRGFEPLAGGMRIALGHADLFVEGHNLAALEALAEVLSGL